MSTKHYFPSTAANSLVPRALRALVTSNPHLALNEAERVVADASHDSGKVSIIGGGGSGHEPAWSGFVGNGLLSAAACGDIFASPSTKQVMAAMRMAPSTAGTILLITNYTGDRLHFGLAAETARAAGLCDKVVILPATDDVSIGKTKSGALGRRGLPGHVFTMKILCAAAAERYSFEQCLEIGKAVNAQTVSIGSALDHCHVPGRQHQSLPEDTCSLGAGIHNEPAQQTFSPMPSVESLIENCLRLLCDRSDPERGFVDFDNSDDSVALLVNNYGGLSPLELGAITDEVQRQLKTTYSIEPCRTLTGSLETSLNAPGFSISLCNISAAARQCQTTDTDLLALYDRPTTAVSWPAPPRPVIKAKTSTSNSLTNGHTAEHLTADVDVISVNPELLEKAVRAGCLAAIAAEPQLTQWDMVMGDGDCGEAVKGLCESLLRNMDNGVAKDGSLLPFLRSTLDAVDDMGGTLGAIFGILLSAFVSSLRARAKDGTADAASPELYASSLASAVESLKSYTAAREGDRTVMDVLLPFTDTFAKAKNFADAVKVAAEKAEATRFLAARFGRATYVGEAAGQELPDPGAWALYEMLSGMKNGLELRA